MFPSWRYAFAAFAALASLIYLAAVAALAVFNGAFGMGNVYLTLAIISAVYVTGYFAYWFGFVSGSQKSRRAIIDLYTIADSQARTIDEMRETAAAYDVELISPVEAIYHPGRQRVDRR